MHVREWKRANVLQEKSCQQWNWVQAEQNAFLYNLCRQSLHEDGNILDAFPNKVSLTVFLIFPLHLSMRTDTYTWKAIFNSFSEKKKTVLKRRGHQHHSHFHPTCISLHPSLAVLHLTLLLFFFSWIDYSFTRCKRKPWVLKRGCWGGCCSHFQRKAKSMPFVDETDMNWRKRRRKRKRRQIKSIININRQWSKRGFREWIPDETSHA